MGVKGSSVVMKSNPGIPLDRHGERDGDGGNHVDRCVERKGVAVGSSIEELFLF